MGRSTLLAPRLRLPLIHPERRSNAQRNKVLDRRHPAQRTARRIPRSHQRRQRQKRALGKHARTPNPPRLLRMVRRRTRHTHPHRLLQMATRLPRREIPPTLLGKQPRRRQPPLRHLALQQNRRTLPARPLPQNTPLHSQLDARKRIAKLAQRKRSRMLPRTRNMVPRQRRQSSPQSHIQQLLAHPTHLRTSARRHVRQRRKLPTRIHRPTTRHRNLRLRRTNALRPNTHGTDRRPPMDGKPRRRRLQRLPRSTDRRHERTPLSHMPQHGTKRLTQPSSGRRQQRAILQHEPLQQSMLPT